MNLRALLSFSALTFIVTEAFVPINHRVSLVSSQKKSRSLLWNTESTTETSPEPIQSEENDEEEPMDAATREMMEKIKRSDELRAQEVFMKRSTGIHKCGNCGWDYDESKGDVMVIGGQIQPGTPFSELPSNWRCPTCRASKDNFVEVVEEIPGFEVNQGYGFGTNSLTAGQKNTLIFGGLGLFFLLFLSGYALS